MRRIRAVNEFTLLRNENKADTLTVTLKNSYKLPTIANIPERETLIIEYCGEEIFSGDIVGYERKVTAENSHTTYTAKGKLERLFWDEAEPGIIKNPSAKGIERRYLLSSGISLCSFDEALGEMNVGMGISVYSLVEKFADEFLGKKTFVRRNKIYFAADKADLKSEKFKMKNAYRVETKIDGSDVFECVRVVDPKSGQYSFSLQGGDGLGTKYVNSLDEDERKNLLEKKVYAKLYFKEKFEDIYPGDTVSFEKMNILVYTVKVTLKNGVIDFSVGGYKQEG